MVNPDSLAYYLTGLLNSTLSIRPRNGRTTSILRSATNRTKYGRRSMVLHLCGNRLEHDNKDKPSKKTSLKLIKEIRRYRML